MPPEYFTFALLRFSSSIAAGEGGKATENEPSFVKTMEGEPSFAKATEGKQI